MVDGRTIANKKRAHPTEARICPICAKVFVCRKWKRNVCCSKACGYKNRKVADPETFKKRVSKYWKEHGHPRGMLGKTHTPEVRKRLSETHKGNRNSNWQGGISKNPYKDTFTKQLKREVYERDGFECVLCGWNRYIVAHHIDGNKLNSETDNLVTMCRSCHMLLHSGSLE